MGRWGDGESGRVGEREMGRWGDGEMGRVGDGHLGSEGGAKPDPLLPWAYSYGVNIFKAY